MFIYRFDIINSNGDSTGKTNVVKYFKEIRNYSIKYPNLPCLKINSKSNNPIAIPIEVSIILYYYILLLPSS